MFVSFFALSLSPVTCLSSSCTVPSLCFALDPSVSHGAQGQYARKLLNDLMKDYSDALRPVEDTDSALNVSLQITLSQIKDMVRGYVITQCRFRATTATAQTSHIQPYNFTYASLLICPYMRYNSNPRQHVLWL